MTSTCTVAGSVRMLSARLRMSGGMVAEKMCIRDRVDVDDALAVQHVEDDVIGAEEARPVAHRHFARLKRRQRLAAGGCVVEVDGRVIGDPRKVPVDDRIAVCLLYTS